jgi:plasmid stabilization system protein ParE
MSIVWTPAGWDDVDRLHAFLAEHDLDAADAVFDQLLSAPDSLLQFPRRGPRLSQYDPREIREFQIGRYRMRYELTGPDIFILRIFHSKEDRFRAA